MAVHDLGMFLDADVHVRLEWELRLIGGGLLVFGGLLKFLAGKFYASYRAAYTQTWRNAGKIAQIEPDVVKHLRGGEEYPRIPEPKDE